jgi:DNA polymerase-1
LREGVKLYTFIEQATKGVCNYDQSKEVVLARSYGMGKDKMSSRMGISPDECDQILRSFDAAVPYIDMLAKAVANMAGSRGFINTLIGHKRHFNLFLPVTPRGQKRDISLTALPFAAAKALWPKSELERAWTYKAFNALIQGGAAGQTKKALVEINRSVGLPQMTVHDEISKSTASEKETRMMNEIMVHCVPLLAPVRADLTVGKTWC